MRHRDKSAERNDKFFLYISIQTAQNTQRPVLFGLRYCKYPFQSRLLNHKYKCPAVCAFTEYLLHYVCHYVVRKIAYDDVNLLSAVVSEFQIIRRNNLSIDIGIAQNINKPSVDLNALQIDVKIAYRPSYRPDSGTDFKHIVAVRKSRKVNNSVGYDIVTKKVLHEFCSGQSHIFFKNLICGIEIHIRGSILRRTRKSSDPSDPGYSCTDRCHISRCVPSCRVLCRQVK